MDIPWRRVSRLRYDAKFGKTRIFTFHYYDASGAKLGARLLSFEDGWPVLGDVWDIRDYTRCEVAAGATCDDADDSDSSDGASSGRDIPRGVVPVPVDEPTPSTPGDVDDDDADDADDADDGGSKSSGGGVDGAVVGAAAAGGVVLAVAGMAAVWFARSRAPAPKLAEADACAAAEQEDAPLAEDASLTQNVELVDSESLAVAEVDERV